MWNNRLGYKTIEGLEIFVIDFSELSGEELVKHIFHCAILLEDIDQPTYFFINLKDTKLDLEMTNYLIDIRKKINNNVFKSAMVGIEGYKAILYKIYKKISGTKAVLFYSEEQAIHYLLSK